jgi:hypothetical protein
MNRYSNIILTAAFIVVSTATVFAQQAQSANPAPPAQTANVLSTELKQLYTIVKNNLTKLAEKMPEEHYGFKAAPEIGAFGQLAAMARCGSCAISPSIVPPSTPDATANPQQKAHTAPVIPSDIACSSSSSPTTLRVQQQTTDIFTELQNHPRASPSVTGAERSVARRETSESGLLRPRHVFE